MVSSVLYSSRSEEWSTPDNLFAELDKEFSFILDVCATKENAKCEKFYTKQDNGLIQPWSKRNWMNPPYGRQIGLWIAKAYEECAKGNVTVCLLPARTDTKWFHSYIYGKAQIRFLKGRLKFSGAKDNAPFPCMVVVFI